jgi:hypothetical protein
METNAVRKPPITISFKLLLSVYSITPILLASALIDTFIFHGALAKYLPNTPEAFVWYTVIFGLPHIMASFFSFADTEYLAFYKQRLIYKLPLLLAAVALASFFLPTAAVLAFVIYTMYHVISQQAGMALIFTKGPPSHYAIWKWTTIVVISCIYLLIYYPKLVPAYFHTPGITGTATLSALLILLIMSVSMLALIKTREGRVYYAAMAGSFILAPLFFTLGYMLFAVAVLRVIHDVSAFIFYATHDNNRFAAKHTNFIYRYLPTEKIPVVVFTPVLAILIALPFTFFTGALVPLLLAFTHYYIEGFVWKRGSIHREQLVFSI